MYLVVGSSRAVGSSCRCPPGGPSAPARRLFGAQAAAASTSERPTDHAGNSGSSSGGQQSNDRSSSGGNHGSSNGGGDGSSSSSFRQRVKTFASNSWKPAVAILGGTTAVREDLLCANLESWGIFEYGTAKSFDELAKSFERPPYNFEWDPSPPNDEELAKDIGRREIVLIRHGQYEINARTDNGRCLTELGREQASLTGKRLFEILNAERLYPQRQAFHKVLYVNSPLRRAEETAAIILEKLNEGLRNSKLSVKIDTPLEATVYPELAEGLPCVPDPDLTQRTDVASRIENAFKTIFRVPQGQNIRHVSTEIYVCHANVIRYFCLRALQLDERAWLRLSIPHASIAWLTIDNRGMVNMRLFGDSGHIPAGKVSY